MAEGHWYDLEVSMARESWNNHISSFVKLLMIRKYILKNKLNLYLN